MAVRDQVRERAADRCEYCQLPQSCTSLPHELDHIRAQKHHGPTTLDNTCWACARCNGFKGTDASGYDPATNELSRLFNPRTDVWSEHFKWQGPTLAGTTKIGRATIVVLQINLAERVEHRRLMIDAGLLLLSPKV